MRARSVRSASRLLIPTLGLAAVLAVSQAAGATEPPPSPPDTEPAATEPAGTDAIGSEPVGTDTIGTDTIGSEPTETTLPEGYVWLVDDTGAITVAVPDTWTDIDTTPQTGPDGAPAPRIAAAPDLTAFRDTFDVPGVEFIAAPFVEDPQATIDDFGLQSGCAETVVEPYENPDNSEFTGLVQVGTQCGEAGEASWSFVVASAEDDSFTALVQVQAATAADDEALGIVLDTFGVAPPGGVPGSTVPSTVVTDTTVTDTVVDDTVVEDTVPGDTGMTETTESV